MARLIIYLVQRGGNKQPIPNQQNAYAVFILTFAFWIGANVVVIIISLIGFGEGAIA